MARYRLQELLDNPLEWEWLDPPAEVNVRQTNDVPSTTGDVSAIGYLDKSVSEEMTLGDISRQYDEAGLTPEEKQDDFYPQTIDALGIVTRRYLWDKLEATPISYATIVCDISFTAAVGRTDEDQAVTANIAYVSFSTQFFVKGKDGKDVLAWETMVPISFPGKGAAARVFATIIDICINAFTEVQMKGGELHGILFTGKGGSRQKLYKTLTNRVRREFPDFDEALISPAANIEDDVLDVGEEYEKGGEHVGATRMEIIADTASRLAGHSQDDLEDEIAYLLLAHDRIL